MWLFHLGIHVKVGSAALFRQGWGVHWPLSFEIKCSRITEFDATYWNTHLFQSCSCIWMFNINFPCVVLIYHPNKKTIKHLHIFWQCSALSITNEASNWTVSWSLINPDLTIRFTCAFSCLHLVHESHCFLFSECVEGSKKSFLFHLHVMPTCSISWLYLCVWYSALLIKALKISSPATITCNNSGTGALASCDRTRSPRGATVLYHHQWWWMMNHTTVQFTTAPLCLLNKLRKHPFAPRSLW